jgi:replicative DNA helicase
MPMSINSKQLEQHVLAGLIQHPQSYTEIAVAIGDEDFYSEDTKVHQTIFRVLRAALEHGEEIDEIVLAQRVKQFNLSFEDNVDITHYIQALGMRKISKDGLLVAAQDLKKFTVRREILNNAREVGKTMKSIPSTASFDEIVETADKIYNSQIDSYSVERTSPENIFSSMEEMVEERGNNPITEFGLMGPHARLNELYGSLLRPGNISVVVARAGVGKTTFCLDFATKVSQKYDNVPVLHFDNGEMSQEELTMRQCAALSEVPLHLIETGEWRHNQECVDKIRAVWPQIKAFQFYYYNVAGMDTTSMINVLRRFYYSKVGRGNKMIFSFDYIKTTDATHQQGQREWEVVGNMVTAFKNLIQKEIVGPDGPMITMITSVQSNRSGVTNNRRVENILDDESIVSLSDRIIQFCSHMFHLRSKTNEEIQAEGANFGTHVLSCFKHRHLGKNVHRALNLVELEDGSKRKNHVNLDFSNFSIKEVGDLQDQVDSLGLNGSPEEDGDNDFADL